MTIKEMRKEVSSNLQCCTLCPAIRRSNRHSDLLTGKELRDDVAQMQKELDGDMRALRGEHAAADRALMMQLRAVLEQARDMRVWREQHNVRVLEMQACSLAPA